MKTRYIFSMGELSRKDNSLMFSNSEKKLYIPIEGTREIYCMNEVSINTKLLDFLSKNQIIIHFFNYHQGYSGTFYPKDHLLSGRLLVKQALCFEEMRVEIAKKIVKGISLNIQEVLYHYVKHGNTEVNSFIKLLKEKEYRIDKCFTINQLLMLEGEIWQTFYATFNLFLNNDFTMNKRIRRPPDNPINAMISFGNMYLYTKTISQIYQTHLDQTISFLHEPSEQRFSLSLDLSEVFKPIIVFKTIFDCVNNKKIQVNKHFEKKYNYCLLNEEGRKRFVKELDDRINTTFMHETLKRKVSYQSAIKYDGYKLIKTIVEGREFVPFSIKDKK